jgi:cysteinyl-tRNA synthetase
MNKDNLNLDKEVENIIKSNGFKIPRDVLDNLVKKYDSRIVENITSLVNKRYKEMINMSIKLADKLINKGYTYTSKNFSKWLVENKDKYMKKLNLTENTFEEFKSHLKKYMKKNTYDDVLPLKNVKSEFGKIFGESYTVDNKSLYIDDSEKPATNNILSLYKNT